VTVFVFVRVTMLAQDEIGMLLGVVTEDRPIVRA
jgi:hypothetical protein